MTLTQQEINSLISAFKRGISALDRIETSIKKIQETFLDISDGPDPRG